MVGSGVTLDYLNSRLRPRVKIIRTQPHGVFFLELISVPPTSTVDRLDAGVIGPTATAVRMSDLASQLGELSELHVAGHLSEDEFALGKKLLLQPNLGAVPKVSSPASGNFVNS